MFIDKEKSYITYYILNNIIRLPIGARKYKYNNIIDILHLECEFYDCIGIRYYEKRSKITIYLHNLINFFKVIFCNAKSGYSYLS